MPRHTNLPQCPKCRNQDYALSITYEEEVYGEVKKGVNMGMFQSAMAQPVRASAECKNCGHCWSVRNANIVQLLNERCA